MPSASCQVSAALALQPVILQQAAEPLARADRIAGEDGLAAFLAQRLDMVDHRLIDIGMGGAFGGEVARTVDLEIEDGLAFGLMERRDEVRGRGLQPFVPFLGRQVQRLGGQRAEAARLRGLGAFAVLIIVGDGIEPAARRRRDAIVAHHHCAVAQMVEQRRQLFLEQRQPMLHARHAPPFGHRLIERVARRRRAEGLAVAGAESLDRLLVEQSLGGGEEGEAIDPARRPLVRRVEGADAFDLVAEEVEAQRLFLAAGEQVDQAAAHGELALIVHRLSADIAVRLEQRRQLLQPDPLAGARRATSWRMRNGVSTRWVAAFAVVRTSCGVLGLA